MKLLATLTVLGLALCIGSAVARPADPFAPKGKPKGHYDKDGNYHTGECGLLYGLTLGNCPGGTDIDNSHNPKGWNRVEPKEKPKEEHTVDEGLKPLDNFDLGGSE